jgi:hypothetical protein
MMPVGVALGGIGVGVNVRVAVGVRVEVAVGVTVGGMGEGVRVGVRVKVGVKVSGGTVGGGTVVVTSGGRVGCAGISQAAMTTMRNINMARRLADQRIIFCGINDIPTIQ